MISRLFSLLGLLYALGFVLFSVTLGEPAAPSTPKVDAAVVLTGGAGRVEHGLEIIWDRKAARLLISGTDPLVTKADLAGRNPKRANVLRCCVDLGTEAKDTRSNAEEAERWLKQHRRMSVRLITSDWHMRRALYEFERVLGPDYKIIEDAVRTEPSFFTLFGEYNKYVLRRIAVWFDI
jgi:uncharacterized SAM-binding protein YcdF (DUF218 family)